MVKKLLTSSALIGAIAMSVFAQNARIESLAESFMFKDMYDLYRNPSYMNDYKDDIQVTFDTPIMGIKSFGDMISVGATFNNALMLKSNFYADAIIAVNALPLTDITGTTQSAPHLLFGLDFGTFQLGLDGFIEYSKVSYHQESQNTAPATTTVTEVDKSVMNPGFQLGGDMAVSDLAFSLVFGMSFPVAKGIQTVKTDGTENTNVKELSNKHIMIKTGADVDVPVAANILKIGATWVMEKYQLKTETTAFGPPISVTTTFDNISTRNTISPYIGIRAALVENIILALQEKSDFAINDTTYEVGDNIEKGKTFTHTVSLGVEKSFARVLFFDSLTLRGGCSYPVTNNLTYEKTVGGTITSETKTKFVTTWGPANPVIGLGASLGVFTLDVTLNPAAWTGVLIGPPVARCTATLAF